MVSMLTIYADSPNSNPTEVYKILLVKNFLKRMKINEKEAENIPLKTGNVKWINGK